MESRHPRAQTADQQTEAEEPFGQGFGPHRRQVESQIGAQAPRARPRRGPRPGPLRAAERLLPLPGVTAAAGCHRVSPLRTKDRRLLRKVLGHGSGGHKSEIKGTAGLPPSKGAEGRSIPYRGPSPPCVPSAVFFPGLPLLTRTASDGLDTGTCYSQRRSPSGAPVVPDTGVLRATTRTEPPLKTALVAKRRSSPSSSRDLFRRGLRGPFPLQQAVSCLREG